MILNIPVLCKHYVTSVSVNSLVMKAKSYGMEEKWHLLQMSIFFIGKLANVVLVCTEVRFSLLFV